MYLAIDIGGTKTLLAAYTNEGELRQSYKFPTPKDYDEFLATLAASLPQLGEHDYRAGCVAVPGKLDRKNGIVFGLGNLPWQNEPIDADIEKITKCPMVIENDAKLAGLSEALILIHDYKRALYITFSTGIGIGLIVDGHIDEKVGDPGGDRMIMEHNGRLMPWEDFASGSAIVKKYGKRASEINDQATWKAIVRTMATGMTTLIAVLNPDVIIIGGGVGSNFHKFGRLLIERLKMYETPMMTIPPIFPAQRPEEAVIYGAYELARQRYGHSAR